MSTYPHILEADRELLADADPAVLDALAVVAGAYQRSDEAQQVVKQSLSDLVKIARDSGIVKADVYAIAQSPWRRAAALSGREPSGAQDDA